MTGDRLKSIGAGVAVAALLLVAILGVALAVDLLRTENRVDVADAAFTSGVDRKVTWDADTLLPVGTSRGILGLADDVTFRKAVQRFWLSEPREPLREFGDVTRRSGAERGASPDSARTTRAPSDARSLSRCGEPSCSKRHATRRPSDRSSSASDRAVP